MSYRSKAWIGLAAYIVAVDICAPRGQTLSEAVDDWLLRRHTAAIAWTVVGLTAGHLLNIIPEQIDPIHLLFSAIGDRSSPGTEG